jgi:hypothetical protein
MRIHCVHERAIRFLTRGRRNRRPRTDEQTLCLFVARFRVLYMLRETARRCKHDGPRGKQEAASIGMQACHVHAHDTMRAKARTIDERGAQQRGDRGVQKLRRLQNQEQILKSPICSDLI